MLGDVVTPVAAVDVDVVIVAGTPADVVGAPAVVTLVVVGRGVAVVLAVATDVDPVGGTDGGAGMPVVLEGC